MKTDHVYIARAACGHVRAAAYDDTSEARRKITSKSVAEWIKRGLTVTRIPKSEFTRELFADDCDECRVQPGGK